MRIRDRIIVCVASCWDYDPTSKHHIMKLLSQTNDVVWVNYHGTRRPSLTRNDFKSACSVLRRAARGIQRVSDSMIQLTPLVLPGATGPLLRAIHRRLLVRQIRRAIKRVEGYRGKRIQVWTFAPDVPFLAGEFDEEILVYYCVDEFTRFEGVDARTVAGLERELIDNAGLVITTSAELARRKGQQRANVHLVRHGVEFNHFAQAWRDSGGRPADLPHNGRPILGFFGLIQHWIDVALLAEAARRRPHYAFVLIGDCKVDVSQLRRTDNVYLLGRRPYADLPDYCRYFDAGLLPFVTGHSGAQTDDINPIKLREYLAAGLPVISTPLPEAMRYKGPVRIAGGAAEFAAQCDAVAASRGSVDREQIARHVADESWESVVAHLATIVRERIDAGAAVARERTVGNDYGEAVSC